jgi:hypothetical protein
MSWHTKATEKPADGLRFLVRAAFIVSAIALALTITYVTVKLCWFTARWLDRIWFSGPW